MMDGHDRWPQQTTTTDDRQHTTTTNNHDRWPHMMTAGQHRQQQSTPLPQHKPNTVSTPIASPAPSWITSAMWLCGKPPPPPNLFAPLHQVHSQQGCSLPPPYPLQMQTWRHIHPCKCRKSTLNNMKLSLSLPPSECFLSFVSYSLYVLCTTN